MRPPAPSTAPATSPTPRVARALEEHVLVEVREARLARPLVGRAHAGPHLHLGHRRQVRLAQQHGDARGQLFDANARQSGRSLPDGLASAGAGRAGARLSAGSDRSLGVYVHFPFCERVCPYCDFAVVATRRLAPADEDRYVAALLARAGGRAPLFAGRAPRHDLLRRRDARASAPRLARADRRGAARGFRRRAARGHPRGEPEHARRGRLPAFRAAGVNRLSSACSPSTTPRCAARPRPRAEALPRGAAPRHGPPASRRSRST